ncbi:hypothetical protein [Actinomadura sp. RB99]|uniref:hypothetical protein n=1 Tax=Actinomadura sp. RB99 TaxID=2691577 RepID=UPI0016831A5D|nr:hypothetical protein [Actinomadura sp. RB99]
MHREAGRADVLLSALPCPWASSAEDFLAVVMMSHAAMAKAGVLFAQVKGDGEHGVVGDGGSTDIFTTGQT